MKINKLMEKKDSFFETVVAIMASDIHLCHKKPIARSPEPDWYEAMSRPLEQLDRLCLKSGAPLIIAGDIFDRWNSNAELINFALEYLPPCYAIPGQHDLPNHNMDDVGRSAYWTLVKAGKICDLSGEVITHGNVTMHGFGWNQSITPLPAKKTIRGSIHLAVCHSYIYNKGNSYPGAPKELSVQGYTKNLLGYDAAVFGDNHKGFLDGYLLNCGTFMRRKADEVDYSPQIGLLTNDGEIITVELDCSEDLFLERSADITMTEETLVGLLEFSRSLTGLSSDSVDFKVQLKQFMARNGTAANVQDKVMEAISGGTD